MMSFKVYIVSIRCLMGLALYNLLDNRDLNAPTLACPICSGGPARFVQAGLPVPFRRASKSKLNFLSMPRGLAPR